MGAGVQRRCDYEHKFIRECGDRGQAVHLERGFWPYGKLEYSTGYVHVNGTESIFDWGINLKYVLQPEHTFNYSTHQVPGEEMFVNKWILHSISEDWSDYCSSLSEDWCRFSVRWKHVCQWKGSTCSQIPQRVIAVCESGCPPPLNSSLFPWLWPATIGGAWPAGGAFNSQWRVLAPAHEGDTIAQASGSCCQRKPQPCDDAVCRSAPIINCFPTSGYLRGCCHGTQSIGHYGCHKKYVSTVCEHLPTEPQALNNASQIGFLV